MANVQRKLAAILFTDIVGYTAMMHQDEQHAVAIMKRYVAVLNELVISHGGKILNDYGDGSLCTFTSATQAIFCAKAIQLQLHTQLHVPLRIGLHVGEIFFEGKKAMGDGVNVASRILSLAEGNTVLFSKEIFDKIRNQPEFKPVSLGRFEFKNVDEPMEIFALSDDGLTVPKRAEMGGKLKSTPEKAIWKKRPVILSVVAACIIAAFFVIYNIKATKGFSSNNRSIVVLPFENYTNEPGQESLINGITEDITTQLSKIADIKVIGRTSATAFKKSNRPLDQIAAVLGVTAYLEGSVLKAGDKVRITAQLIDAVTQQHIWAESYDRDLKNIFLMQSDVAQQIALQLHARLTAEEKQRIDKKPTDNPEAYKYYRRGRTWWDKGRTVASFDSAETNYKSAIELDPDYALAYSGLADLYIYNVKLPQLEAVPVARDYAKKALSLDSTLSEPLTTLGFIQSAFDYDWTASEATLKKAILLNPNYPTAHLFYGNLLQYTGKNTEMGISEIKKAISLDPLSLNLNYVLGRNYYYAKNYDSAYDQLKKALVLGPHFNLAMGNLAYVLLAKKNYSEAFKIINDIDTTQTTKTSYLYRPHTILSYAYAISGDKNRARIELEKSIKESPYQTPFFLAQAYIALNDYNSALTELEKAYKMRDLWMYALYSDPTFDPIRSEPRFKLLMKKMRLG